MLSIGSAPAWSLRGYLAGAGLYELLVAAGQWVLEFEQGVDGLVGGPEGDGGESWLRLL